MINKPEDDKMCGICKRMIYAGSRWDSKYGHVCSYCVDRFGEPTPEQVARELVRRADQKKIENFSEGRDLAVELLASELLHNIPAAGKPLGIFNDDLTKKGD